MKWFFGLVLVAALVAAAIWYGIRIAERSSPVAVTSLLPKETLLLAHVPDLRRSRSQWHETDLYHLWREPAVQDFLRKSLTKIPKSQSASQRLADFEQLDPHDAFFAVISRAKGELKLVGGFRCKGHGVEAQKWMEQWRARLLAKFPNAKSETIAYQQHQIESASAAQQTLLTVRDEDWIFAGNDLGELKSILDRADGRVRDRENALTGDATFAAAMKHMPSSYAALLYGRVDRYLERLSPLLDAASPTAKGEPPPLYRQIHALCGAFTFEDGKIRDVLFLGMPKAVDAGPLTRASLSLGTKETFLYLASFLNIPKQMQWPAGATGAVGALAPMQKLADALASTNLTLAEWTKAFGPELGLLGDWPPEARLPSLMATLPVKDAPQARQVLAKLTAPSTGPGWIVQEKNGVSYYSLQSTPQVFSFAPSLALSDRMLLAGTNASAMEAAMTRATGGESELAASDSYEKVAKLVPTPHEAFVYLDAVLLYDRLDAALRPVLLLAAAFSPWLNENVDLSKWPPAKVVTEHLSPIVMSQDYEDDGYVTESIGPITIYQAGIGLLVTGGGLATLYRQQQHAPASAQPSATAKPAPSPLPSARGTPLALPTPTP